ncbi:nucleoside phosphorylase [Corynebacterium poyangense]|uniref:Nucleoside phosphorylase n=1 Tax=Corynebacterium poyangense TaxID=2684405 RepID=A0A7H0SLQ8_9CORY|nr:nucleosidase [Corynebacterium poyangense]QNQ89483.1 nucleoside phosphorylase [Corynebacterium poyangense]
MSSSRQSPLCVVATEVEASHLDPELPTLITGIGRLNAATALTDYLAHHSAPSHIINVGTAGALSKAATPGIVHPIGTVYLHDFSHEAIEAICGDSPYPPLHLNSTGLRLATGDQFIDTASARQALAKHAELVDMEGYAIAWVAQRYSIPVHLLKIVSDDANSDSRRLWHDAARQCSRLLGEWVRSQ